MRNICSLFKKKMYKYVYMNFMSVFFLVRGFTTKKWWFLHGETKKKSTGFSFNVSCKNTSELVTIL